MAYVDNQTRATLRKLARQGRLIDTAFKTFQRAVYEAAPPDQVATMRIAFFAGAAELFAILGAGLDDEPGETEGDLTFMQGWVDEIDTFHRRTMAAMRASEEGRPQ